MAQQTEHIPIEARKVRLSEKLNLKFPYDWSNPDIGEDAFINNVLNRCYLQDIVTLLNYHS